MKQAGSEGILLEDQEFSRHTVYYYHRDVYKN